MDPRRTRQRQAIRAVFTEATRPLGPQEIWAEAQRHCPGIGIATVYRSIRSLLDEKWVVAVEIPGDADRFERSGKEHHHHFVCRQCGLVYELAGCIVEVETLAPSGFLVESHELVLKGRCSSCPE